MEESGELAWRYHWASHAGIYTRGLHAAARSSAHTHVRALIHQQLSPYVTAHRHKERVLNGTTDATYHFFATSGHELGASFGWVRARFLASWQHQRTFASASAFTSAHTFASAFAPTSASASLNHTPTRSTLRVPDFFDLLTDSYDLGPDNVRGWLHTGSVTVAYSEFTTNDDGSVVGTGVSRASCAYTNGTALGQCANTTLSAAGYSPMAVTPGGGGGGVAEIVDAGYTAVGFWGSFPRFHTPDDDETSVGPEVRREGGWWVAGCTSHRTPRQLISGLRTPTDTHSCWSHWRLP